MAGLSRTKGSTLSSSFGGGSSFARTQDLKTSQGLYSLASQSGLKDQADEILKKNAGETNKFMSGGLITDFFDILNTSSYGVVGLLKGKSFSEGIKQRASFADEDALGSQGIAGKIFGTILDIAVDPLTYIAPLTILKKVPGLTKLAKVGKELAFGKMVEKGIEGTAKSFQTLEGGSTAGKFIAEKFAYIFGKDPVYRAMWERMEKNVGVGATFTKKITDAIVKLPEDKLNKLIQTGADFRPERANLEELSKILSPDELVEAKRASDFIDDLGQQMVDLGLLSKETYLANQGRYLKAIPERYAERSKGVFGYLKSKIIGQKARKEMTEEVAEAQKYVKNPAYIFARTATGMIKDIENAKFFNGITEKFGSDIAQEGFSQMPKTASFITKAGKQSEILSGVKKINEQVKPMLNELKITFRGDKKVLSEIGQLEKEIGELGGKRGDELYKFFNEGTLIATDVKTARKLGTLPEVLQPIAEQLKRFNTLQDALKSDVGIQLEKMFEDGVLERNGFKDLESFFDTIKNPFKAGSEEVNVGEAVGNIPKIISLQKRIEQFTSKSKILKEVDKTSINDSFRFLEKNINDLRFQKDELLEELSDVKLGNLAGKYVPDTIHKDLTEMLKPPTEFLQVLQKLTSEYKFFKVVLNPASNIRNIISNKLLNNFDEAGIPLYRLDMDYKGMQSFLKKDKWYQEVEKLGGAIDTFTSQEIGNLLDGSGISKMGSGYGKFKEYFGSIYQGEEMTAKMSMYIYQRTAKKLNPEDAWKIADRATFNYAQVTPFVRKLRTNLFGFPFITFTVKSAPVVGKTILTHPTKISNIGKIKNSIEKLANVKETEAERANEPEWVKNGFYVKLPFKDDKNRSAYFDLTYILPFGDLALLGDETQLSVFSKSPALSFIRDIGNNKDYFGNKIWKESDNAYQKTADIMRHLTKSALPPPIADQIPGGYKQTTGERIDKFGRIGSSLEAMPDNQRRSLMEEMARMSGFKVQPIVPSVQESMNEWNTKKDFETLLNENQILQKYESFYVPKK